MGWTKADTTQLIELFKRGPHKNGIKTSGLRPKDIHDAIARYFPDRNYDTFAPLLRRKAKAFELDRELSGARKKKKKKKSE